MEPHPIAFTTNRVRHSDVIALYDMVQVALVPEAQPQKLTWDRTCSTTRLLEAGGR